MAYVTIARRRRHDDEDYVAVNLESQQVVSCLCGPLVLVQAVPRKVPFPRLSWSGYE